MRPWNPPLLWPRGAAPWHRGTVAEKKGDHGCVREVQSGQLRLAGCESRLFYLCCTVLQVDLSNFRHLG